MIEKIVDLFREFQSRKRVNTSSENKFIKDYFSYLKIRFTRKY